ncbi:hypothetical protein Tco_0146210 [Tanacetum coccineum]
MELSQLKQFDHSAQLLESVKSQLLTMVDDLLSTRIGYATRTALHLLHPILPKEVSDFVTLVIQSTITESLENVILLDKLEKSKSYRAAEDHRNLYDTLVKSYQLYKDLFDSYGKAYSLKRSREDKDKDEDPPARPDQGLKKKKTSKDVEPSRGSKSKESNKSSSKGTKS